MFMIVGSSKKAKIVESKNANHSKPNHTWGSNATDIPSFLLLVMTGCPDCSLLDSGTTILQEFRVMVTISGNVTISKYATSRGLEYTCFLLLAKDGLARGIPRLKFQKDHLCSACALGKSKKSSHQPKAEDTNQEKLYLLHMDLCGLMRVASINGKRYILVIVDDYLRFTWVRLLGTKDEAPEAIIKCIKNIQVRLNATVANVRTDNGTKFVNQTLRKFYENVGISHQTSVARTPQQNGVDKHHIFDGTLTSVRTVLHDIASNLRMDYLPKIRWSNLDRQWSRIMIKEIDKLQLERRLMRSLEKFVGGSDYGIDLRLLKRII
ncbi:retrovirus-related pol polyprotein from transposon TNT 1-94 [Tanacetum coccineum]